MARLVPSDIDLVTGSAKSRGSEAHTLVRLRDGLDDSYTVYHGVHWTRAGQSGYSVYGEIDFIVANEAGRLLAIEHKAAEIIETESDLFARYRQSGASSGDPGSYEDKSITTQVNRNLNEIRSGFAHRHPGRTLEIEPLLHLPLATLGGNLPSSINRSRVVDSSQDAGLVGIVKSILGGPDPRAAERRRYLEDIHDYLSQRIDATPQVALLGRAARDVTTRLSGGLATWADRLSMAPWRLRVNGTAGSGKTQLALRELRRARADRKTAIYVCFNRPLRDAMRVLAPDADKVLTFHEFAKELCVSAGLPALDLSDSANFAALARRFVELAVHVTGAFDTVVIDEGQDFEPEWAQALIGMARPDGRVLWLEDQDQSLYGREPADLPGWVGLASPLNYRSPRRLVAFMNQLELTGQRIESGSAIPGNDPIWIVHDDGASAIAATEEAIRRLSAADYKAPNIAVLSYRGLASSVIAGASGPSTLAGIGVRRPAGYTPDGDALWTRGDLLVDTLFRFKGQAADAVVVTEIDFETFDQKARRRLFVALTRARLQAVLVSTNRAKAAILRDLAV
jgi:hypothetical protein